MLIMLGFDSFQTFLKYWDEDCLENLSIAFSNFLLFDDKIFVILYFGYNSCGMSFGINETL